MNKLLIKLSAFTLAAVSLSCTVTTSTNQSANANTSVVVNSNVNVADVSPATGTVAQLAPEAVVADLYKQHDAKKSPFFQTKDRALVDKYFTKPTADMIWKDAVESKGEVGALEADPLYDAQDTDIKNFAVGKADIKGAEAVVPVTFKNMGTAVTVIYNLAEENGAWKISDIKYSGGYTLVGLFKENASLTAPKAAADKSKPDVFGYFYLAEDVPEFKDFGVLSLGGTGEYGAQAKPPFYGHIELEDGTRYKLLPPTITGKNLSFKTEALKGISYDFKGTLTRTDLNVEPQPGSDEVVLKGTLTKLENGKSIAGKDVGFTWTVGE